MKVQIRQGVFETNSSSTHSMTMCLESDYQAWLEGKMKYCEYFGWGKEKNNEKHFLPNEEADAWNRENLCLKDGQTFEEAWEELIDEGYDTSHFYLTREEYDKVTDNTYSYEGFSDDFETPSGEKVRAFGYFGYDG